MSKIKLGFFGGSFNTPINTHTNIANKLIKDKILDNVIFVPVGDYYSKKNLIAANHRYNMLKILCKENKNFRVENIASSSTKMLYAIDTFRLIYEKYHNVADIYFIMGSDNFKKISTWKDHYELLDKYNFIVVSRGEQQDIPITDNVFYYKNIEDDITSTCIRKKIAQNEDVSKYISPSVIKYIKENKLYGIA